MTYLDVLRRGTFPGKQEVSVLPIANTNRRMTEHLTLDRFGNILFAKAQHLITESGTYLSTKAQPFVNKHQAIIFFLVQTALLRQGDS